MILPIHRPLTPMLTRPEPSIPEGSGWLYEPKLDGFRAIVHYDGTQVHVDSRNGKSLNRYFPELVAAIPKAVGQPCVLDGEVVACGADGLSFQALQKRLSTPGHQDEGQEPVSFIAFDLLALMEQDLMGMPFRRRRTQLDKTLNPSPTVTIIPQTSDSSAASNWMTFPATGIEGVVAKPSGLAYRPGQRVMVKVRPRRSVDCVVGGYVPHDSGEPFVLLLGLFDRCGILHHAGQTAVLSAASRKEAATLLRKLRGGTSFTEGRVPGYSRWREQRVFEWVSVRPNLVCEVAVGNVDNGQLRHAAKLTRWRMDKEPMDCTYSQLA